MHPTFRNPAFAPYRRWLARIGEGPPRVDLLDAWARECGLTLPDGRALRIQGARAMASALGYESAIAGDAMLPIREGDWHDAFNALVWLALPRTKAALNARHVAEPVALTPNARSRIRDAATLLDESGLLLACDDPTLPPLLIDHAWRTLFVERAADLRRHSRAVVIGHGLLDKLRAPFRALTAKVLVVPFDRGSLPSTEDLSTLDARAAAAIAGQEFAPEILMPLPLAALPGWDHEALGERLFDDVSVFRPRQLGC